MKKNKECKSNMKQSAKDCKKMNVKNSQNNNSNKKITGFDESKSFELDHDNDDSFELK